MTEYPRPTEPIDIIQSAERLSVVSSFAIGESKGMLEAAKLMPEYRDLVGAYGGYCIDVLRDRRVTAYLSDFCIARGEDPYTSISVTLTSVSDHPQMRFGVMQTSERDGEEAINKRIGSFEQRMRIDFAPLGVDPEEVEWNFRYSYRNHGSYDVLPQGDVLIACIAEREFKPEDFISHPDLLPSFVRKINKDMTKALQTILLGASRPNENVDQRAQELVGAFRGANAILATVLESGPQL